MDELLRVFARQLIFRNICELLVHNGCLLPLAVKNRGPFGNLAKTTYDGCVDKPNRFVNIRIINARYQGSLRFLDQMLLYCSNTLDVFYVFVKLRINCHVLCSNSKSLFVLILVCYTDNKGDA